jgi:hypothetical protein
VCRCEKGAISVETKQNLCLTNKENGQNRNAEETSKLEGIKKYVKGMRKK